MLKKMLTPLLLAAASAAWGNAGVFAGGGNTPVTAKTDAVQMVAEEVTMAPQRGNYPVDTSARNLDPMKFHCTFLLRNLTDKNVMLQVGFPLSTEAVYFKNPADINQAELAARFGFVAGTRDRVFPVRYVTGDRDGTFHDMFMWDMAFKPHEDVTLYVCYTMGGYMGIGSCEKARPRDRNAVKCRYLEELSAGISEGNVYVTGTGSCWAGKIEKAVFKIYPRDFEEYLDRRGPFEVASYDRPNISRGRGMPALHHRVRTLIPADGWVEKSDADGRVRWLELCKAPFEPGKADSITLAYTWTSFPVTRAEFDDMACRIRDRMDSAYAAKQRRMKDDPAAFAKEPYWKNCEPYNGRVLRNLADAVLEFYGVQTGNAEIRDFLENQAWYPQKTAPQMDPELKSYLMQKEIPFPEETWRQYLAAKQARNAEWKRKARADGLRTE